MRYVLALLALAACADPAPEVAPTAPERMRFTVEQFLPAAGDTVVVLAPMAGDSQVVVAKDSLAKDIRLGQVVRRGTHAGRGGRTLTWVRDTQANRQLEEVGQ